MKLNLNEVAVRLTNLLNEAASETGRPASNILKQRQAEEILDLFVSGQVTLVEPKAATENNETLVKRIADLERQLSSAHSQLDNLLEDNQKLMVTKAELEGDVRRLAGDRNTGLLRLHGSLAEYVGEADEGRNVVYRMNGKLRTMAGSSWCSAAARAVSVTEAARMLVERIDAANKVIYTNMPTSDKSDTEVLREVIGHLDNADIVLLMNALRAKDGGL